MAAGSRLIRLDKELEGRQEGEWVHKERRESGGQGSLVHTSATIYKHTHWGPCYTPESRSWAHLWMRCLNSCSPLMFFSFNHVKGFNRPVDGGQ